MEGTVKHTTDTLPLKLLFSTSSFNIWNCVWFKNLRSLITHSLITCRLNIVQRMLQAQGETSELLISLLCVVTERALGTKRRLCSFYSNNSTGMKPSLQVRTVYLSSVLGKEGNLRLHGFSYSITRKTYPDHTPTIQIWMNSSSL